MVTPFESTFQTKFKKMKPTETLNEIVILINKLDEVNVVRAEYSDARIRIEMTIGSYKSHHWLVYCLEAANIILSSLCGQHRPSSEAAEKKPELCVTYSFFIKKYENDDEDFEHMLILGAQLIWLIHRAGNIEKDEANRLLKAWKMPSIEKYLELEKMRK